jgi:tetraacyldisaccharide 4'-kinase
MLRAPKFWNKKGILSKILLPFSWLYIYISNRRSCNISATKLPVPVICVGNLVMGGAGKTPMVIALVQMLQAMGYKPHIISRGYGAIVHGVKRVDPEKHNYLNVGDEPLLLAKLAPTWVSTNRLKAARAAVENNADVIVMDDGFQNNSIIKDINLIVVDAIQGFGNQYVFPAGPLREPFLNGLNKADATIVIGEGELSYLKSSKKIFHAQFVQKEPLKKHGDSVIAFAGLGYPKKFKQSLKKAGFKIVEFHAYPDHHPYTITEIEKLLKRSQSMKVTLITTSKDSVRLPLRYKNKVAVFKVNLDILEKEELQKFLTEKMNA